MLDWGMEGPKTNDRGPYKIMKIQTHTDSKGKKACEYGNILTKYNILGWN